MPQIESNNLNGADLLVRKLIESGIDTIFCITGAGNLAIVDAIVRDGTIKMVYSHHEQAAVMEAQGYSRVTNKISLALVTTGGGIANTLTGVLSAYLDSVPVLIISGNESSFHCENYSNLRAYGVQGFDSVEVFKKVTKYSNRILSTNEIIPKIEEALTICLSQRQGPVLIDFPMDLQRKNVTSEQLIQTDKRIEQSVPKSLDEIPVTELRLLSEKLAQAERPILLIGNGCRDSETRSLVLNFIEKESIPFSLSWSAIDLISSEHPLNIGRIGIYGDRATNILLQKSDLLISLGSRLAIPQVGYDKADFGRRAEKWIIEIDPTECQKFEETNWHILNTSALNFLIEFQKITNNQEDFGKYDNWLKEIEITWDSLPRMKQIGKKVDSTKYVHSADVIKQINLLAEKNAVITTDVGAGLLTGHYVFEPSGNQRFFTSQGLGEMGFGLPGAIGAYFADMNRQLICLNTDGGIMFNLQELQLIRDHEIPIKLFVFNNEGYSMIKISQENLFSGRLAGSDIHSGVGFPKFQDIAKTFDLKYLRIESETEIELKIKESFKSEQAVLIEVVMSPAQKYLPRLSTSKTSDGSLISPPLEDLDPLLSIEQLEKLLGSKAHKNSYLARGIDYSND